MKYLKSKPGSLEASAGQVSGFATEQEYQKLFKKELDKAGKGIASMSDQEKKSFFNKVDKMYKGKNEAKVDELTSAQKKLPPALQKAIKAKEKNEDLDSKDKPTVKDVAGQLKKAVKAHGQQAKDLEKAIKTEADTKGDDINQGKLDMVKKGEKKPVDPEPKIGKSIKEMMKKKKDDVATMADTEKDKEKKATTLVGSKKSPVDLKPEVEYKN
jgi:hypothetical protein|tara:strand:- start:2278 stop:2916 length:639 start_codon:yes stop_codon:yes gene_type:complete